MILFRFLYLPEITTLTVYSAIARTFISPKRSKQLVYVNTNLQKILKGANSFRKKFKILKGANSFGEQILSLKDKKTAILNSQNIGMLQTHVNNDIYNKYCLIHNT